MFSIFSGRLRTVFYGRLRRDLIRRRAPLASGAMDGVNIVIVGGTDGLGRALALEAVDKGASVRVVGRTNRDAGTPGLSFIAADLSSMVEARNLAKSLSQTPIDILVFTNGVLAGPNRRSTSEGIEYDLAVSYLSRYVMLREIAPTLSIRRSSKIGKSRVFITGYPGVEEIGDVDDFNSESSYGIVKTHVKTVIGNEALVLDSVTRYPEINVYGLNPGFVSTNIRAIPLGKGSLRHKLTEFIISLLFPSAKTYAKKITPLLTAEDLENQTGTMFNGRGEAIEASRVFLSGALTARVMQLSADLAGRALTQ